MGKIKQALSKRVVDTEGRLLSQECLCGVGMSPSLANVWGSEGSTKHPRQK